MLNNIDLMGRLTRDPELRYTPAGVAVANFTLANDTGRKRDDGSRITHFIDCVAWRNTAEFAANYLTKGRLIVIEGQLETRTYEKDGIKRKAAEVNVRSIHFADSKRDNAQGEGNGDLLDGFTEVEMDDDLPL